MKPTNPLNITNSQLAQVQAQQIQIIQIFNTKFSHLQHRRNFYTNIHTVTRFSIARQYDKKKTNQMWINWVQWYQNYKPDLISEKQNIISQIHSSGKYRYCAFDKQGCPVLVIRMKCHVKGLATVQQNLRYLIYMIQKGVALAKEAKTYQISVIYDRRNMQQSDEVSQQSMKKLMPILSDYYPQTLKSFYVLGINAFWRAAWQVVKFFLPKRTQQKMNVLEDQKQLTNYIDISNLAVQYGGPLKIQQTKQI